MNIFPDKGSDFLNSVVYDYSMACVQNGYGYVQKGCKHVRSGYRFVAGEVREHPKTTAAIVGVASLSIVVARKFSDFNQQQPLRVHGEEIIVQVEEKVDQLKREVYNAQERVREVEEAPVESGSVVALRTLFSLTDVLSAVENLEKLIENTADQDEKSALKKELSAIRSNVDAIVTDLEKIGG